MTLPRLNAVGFCAHYSLEGDWAFDYALSLSRLHAIRLNVFHFLTDPYDPEDQPPSFLSKADRTQLIVERERELRMYYDSRAGDYLEVGFRLCEDNEWTELHRCLLLREFQVLVLGYVGRQAMFAGKPIGISLPNFINLRVEKTDPWVKGDTASGDSKPATLETGYVLNVPPFIEEGQLIKIDTRSGEYVERVKE